MAVKIDILSHQAEFICSNARHTGLVAGLGSGKSIAGILKTIEKKKQYPGIDVAYYLPTYPLIKSIAFPNFEKWLTHHKIPYNLHETDKEFITPLGKIILRSMDNFNLIVGYEVGYSLVDEADVLPKDKMNQVVVKIIARNRSKLPNGNHNQLDFIGTPEGFKFLYEFFIKGKSNYRKLIKAKSTDNPFLPDGYIDGLREAYTEEQLEAYVNGVFVNINTGTVYYRFDRKDNHSTRIIKPNEVLHVGMDFNITNMNAVIHVIDGVPVAVAEITGAYDTYDIANQLKERFKGHSIVIYPDASGQSRSTSGQTDVDILKKHRFTVRVPKQNPLIKDRVNTMNMAFCDNNGNRGYKVNTDNCPVYTDALEKQAYKNGFPDKDGGFDHINEAGGYFIWGWKKKKTFRMSA